jgi:O-antigen/teichoic acid export membrane protein
MNTLADRSGRQGAAERVRIDQRNGVSDPLIARELKRRASEGALASLACQAASLALRTGSMMILARLLVPTDFGLVGMVMAVTGMIGIMKEAGLSDATVQSPSVNGERLSMLFWINVAVGCGLAMLCAALAPILAAFYHEPRVLWITLAVGTGFLFTGLGVQHRARLLRDMRIRLVALMDLASLLVSVVISIGMAAFGWGYWSLVAGAITIPAGNALAAWLATGWTPLWPRRHTGVGHMLAYGTTITLNSAIIYFSYNVEKVLLGRFWGPEVLGVYGRAYQLINLPNDSLQSTIGSVAFPTLARVQTSSTELRNYFLRIYAGFVSLSLPITTVCGLFAEDLVAVFLGSQWHASADVFRRLSPTIMVYALINPLSWLMFATGRVRRSLAMSLVIAPVVVLAYALGLSDGPNGVALNYSVAMVVLAIPLVFWATRGTSITVMDILRTIAYPTAALVLSAGAVFLVWPWIAQLGPALLRLILGCAVLYAVYLAVLLFVFGQLQTYLRQLRHVGFLRRWLPGHDEIA